uniref:NADH dehydrogenase [ubiquinone] 1 beta subcomplex subunit 9 n=1 Tax=Rhinopithecus roxellana TaxID=61622 RepID=A0A2K6PV69_RHIRO
MALLASGAYLTHQQKVLRLYKRALRHLESWCVHRDKYRYFACLLRAQFEEHKNEKDMMKATQLLKEAEEEFWYRQHPQPYIFPDSPGGTSYERYDCYKLPEWCLDDWHPSEKAMYPDYFAKREQWKKLRRESWEREVQVRQELGTREETSHVLYQSFYAQGNNSNSDILLGLREMSWYPRISFQNAYSASSQLQHANDFLKN